MTNSISSILIVDDDPTLLRLLSILLREEGYNVLAADSAEKALVLLAVEKPDLIVTDLQMGKMNGLELFNAVHKTHPMLPIIILTAYGTIPDAVEATKRGVFTFLTKPYEVQDLLNEISNAMAMNEKNVPVIDTSQSIITRSPAMLSMLDEARSVAAVDASVLISGETGSGKELLARTIHEWSPRRDKSFVAINCGAIPEDLLESELFGHVKGAFTGATRDHHGLFQEANGGTIFLDEIGDLPLSLQVKLLRVLQEMEIRPVGSARSQKVDVRVISATHRHLESEISEGRFREDLYYRLNVISFHLPPISSRREDIPLLAQHFLQVLSRKYRKPVNGFAADAIDALLQANWPGNVRQIFNVVEKCIALSTTPIIPLSLVARAINRTGEEQASFDDARRDFEREYLLQLLKMTNGNVTKAARVAKRNRSDFYSLLNRHQIEAALFKS